MKIFVTDDDAMLRMVIIDHLTEEGREFVDFESGEEMLQQINESPDLILMDIDMPGMGGIEASRAWRERSNEETQIIFISSHDDLETRITAYDAGGNDYIIKPVDAAELRRKVKVAEDFSKQKKLLAAQAELADITAHAALSAIGEMHVIQQFMRSSFTSTSLDELIEAVIIALNQYELPALLEIKADFIPDGVIHRSTTGEELTQLEHSLLNHASTMEQVFQFRDRMVINYSGITILISKLPLNDPDRIERLKENLAILAEGASTRISALGSEIEKDRQNQEVVSVMSNFVKTLELMQDNQSKSNKMAKTINEELLRDLVDAFVSLGLTDKQEGWLIDIAEKAQVKLEKLRNQDITTNEELLNQVAERLHQLLGQEETMTFF